MPRSILLFALNGIAVITLSAQSSSLPDKLPQTSSIISGPTADPVQYTFSLAPGAEIAAAVVDQAGDVYFAGSTGVQLPATPSAFQTAFAPCAAVIGTVQHPGHAACSWAFVGKLAPDGSIVWLTYLADPNGNSAIGNIAVDGHGSVYVTGTTGPVNLPSEFPISPGAFEPVPDSSGTFIAALNASGSQLLYATYFNGVNLVEALFPDSGGNLYLGTRTEALVALPLVHPLAGMAPSIESGYLAKLNAAGSALLFASWVNGPGARSQIDALTVDGSGNLYITGGCSYDSPVAVPCVPTTPGAFQTGMKGTSAMYVMKLMPDGTLVFSTLLSGTSHGGAVDIHVAADGGIVLAGAVFSAGEGQPIDFPVTPSAFQTTALKRSHDSAGSGFIAKLNSAGSSLVYSTFLGGSSDDSITGFALDSRGNVVFNGYANSPDLPMTADALQPCHPPPNFQNPDGSEADFIGQLSADGQSLIYASFVGTGVILADGQTGSTLSLVGIDAGGDLYFLGFQPGFYMLQRYRMTSSSIGSAACIASATDGFESAVVPLGLLRIRGNLVAGPRSISPALTAGALPSNYAGLQVFMGPDAAPLLAVGVDGITVVAPYVTSGSVTVRVIQAGVVTAELDCPVQSIAPAIVTSDGSGFGAAAAINQDGSVNSHSNPAAPGSVVALFSTGLGIANPQLQVGTIVNSPGSVEASVGATLFNSAAQILYAGPAPGLLAGVYQINLRVPATGISDWVPLQIEAGGQYSQIANVQEVGIYVSCPPGSACVLWP